MPLPIHGVLPILHTPFLDSDDIDTASLKREIDWIFSIGAHGVGAGMVSETLRLSNRERLELTEWMVQFTAGRGSTFASVGAETTRQACQFAAAAERAGCDAVMAVPPVTARVDASALLDYYRAIATHTSLPVIVQDASGYVGQSIPLSVQLALLEQFGPEKILFKPEAAPIGPSISSLRDATGGRAKIFEGSGGILLVDSFRRGIAGVMPGVDLLDGILALWRALQQSAGAASAPLPPDDPVYRIYFPICAIVALQMQAGLDGFLAIEKYLLVKRGLFPSARRRSPYNWSLDPETQLEVDRLFALLIASLSPPPSP